MSLWRLEWLRLLRTHRLLALAGLFLSLGLSTPLLTRYAADVIERFGGGVRVELPDPVPADALRDYAANAQQLGLLLVVVVAAAALALDARPEAAAFFRTRVAHARDLVLPRWAATAAAAGGAFLLGALAAWYETVVLLGAPDPPRLLLGLALQLVFLGFAVAVVALAAGLVRSVVATVMLSLGTLLALPLVSVLDPVEPWLPSYLVVALDGLLRGTPLSEYLPALAVTLVATAAALALAVRLVGRREL